MRVLLKADINQDGGGSLDQAIADALNISVSTIERVRQRFVEGVCQKPSTVNRKLNINHVDWRPRSTSGSDYLAVLLWSCRWTLRLLAERLIELEQVEHFMKQFVRP